jgi:poly(glycerol-phosphate) alpha-glucosyltransferase
MDISVAFLTPSVSRAAGGILEVERRLAQCLHSLGDVNVEVFGAQDEYTNLDAPGWSPIKVHAYPYRGPGNFRWSPALKRAFLKQRANIAHLQSLWMHTSIIMRLWSRVHRRPYVTTLHGMLDPWAVRNSGWKKKLCSAAYERGCLEGAACLHVFTEGELVSARQAGLENAVCIIPNGVDLPEPVIAPPPWQAALPPKQKTLLFLGRFHPKKGLVSLLSAWGALRQRSPDVTRGWSLVLAGWDQGRHERELQLRTSQLGMDAHVHFAGPLFGEAKAAAYAHADACVLPSLSEGLPMTVLEAWSYGKPVLMTPQCNLGEGFEAGAAIEACPEADSLEQGLATLLGASDGERAAMGRRGLELVKRKFTWPRVATEMHAVYRWLVGGGAAPACVVRS